jgi:colicin import membrane protein
MYKTLTLPLLLTLFFHGAILAVILIDLPDSKTIVKRAATRYIQAELVTLEKPKAKPVPAKSPPKPKPTPPPKQDDSKAKQRALEQQKAEQAKKQALAQQQKQQQIKKQQLEQQQREQRRQEDQRRLREQSERELADAIAQENAQQQAQTDAELANSYIALITEVIQNNWSRPPSARNAMEAELALQLVPTGEVVSVKVIKSSGNAAFDRSAETAVLKAGRFPELQKLPVKVFEQYFRHLRLKFKPEDLRL